LANSIILKLPIEGANMLLIGDKPNLKDCDFVFLALHDTSLVGVFSNKAPNEFLFDAEGNSITFNHFPN